MLDRVTKARLIKGLRAAIAVPFIDDIEDYIWEAIFSYAHKLPLIDPLTNTRTKLLFDVVNKTRGIGWSCKALQWPIQPGGEFELVIQRADIIKKARALGFLDLTLDSPCGLLGEALLKHWCTKISEDAATQGIVDRRVAILLKSDRRTHFSVYEGAIAECRPRELIWNWTDGTRTGLQGKRKKDGFCVYRWYPNQKQLFERFRLPKDAPIIEVMPRRLPLDLAIDSLIALLEGKR